MLPWQMAWFFMFSIKTFFLQWSYGSLFSPLKKNNKMAIATFSRFFLRNARKSCKLWNVNQKLQQQKNVIVSWSCKCVYLIILWQLLYKPEGVSWAFLTIERSGSALVEGKLESYFLLAERLCVGPDSQESGLVLESETDAKDCACELSVWSRFILESVMLLASTVSLDGCGWGSRLFLLLTPVHPVCRARRSMRILRRGFGIGFEFWVKGTPVNGSLGKRPHVASLFWYSSSVLLSITIPLGKIIGKTMSSCVKGSRNSSGIGISVGTGSGLGGMMVLWFVFCKLFTCASQIFSSSDAWQQREGKAQMASDLMPSADAAPL